MSSYDVTKRQWSEDDFDAMCWHDCTIYGLVFPPDTYELMLDIDYIMATVPGESHDKRLKFWISPATMIFNNVNDLEIDFDEYNGMEIDSIIRSDPRSPRNARSINKKTEWLWTISCHRGDISFRAVGFTQQIRSDPRLSQRSRLEADSRGGYFSRLSGELNSG